MEDPVLTARQVMARLNVGRSLIYQLAADGILPSIRIRSAGSRRGALRFFGSDVEAYLARLRAGSKGRAAGPDPDEVRREVTAQWERLAALGHLAAALHNSGDQAGARPLYEEQLAMLRRTRGDGDANTVQAVIDQMGVLVDQLEVELERMGLLQVGRNFRIKEAGDFLFLK